MLGSTGIQAILVPVCVLTDLNDQKEALGLRFVKKANNAFSVGLPLPACLPAWVHGWEGQILYSETLGLES